MNWYLAVLKNYAGFSGRARRTEYWMYFLIHSLIYILLAVIGYAVSEYLLIVAVVYVLAVAVPSLAVTVRRLHDTGRSGAWFFIALLPLVGPIVLIVFMAQAGVAGPNEYGADPKQVPAYA
ncbi:MAG TPA: DUF805 domain-containing protein [Catenuloplanes sp.]|jgi:uncharacterized membrane protein YhaH (DUF805 family)